MKSNPAARLRRLLLPVAAACIPLVPITAGAQPASRLEPVVVTGARAEQLLDETLAPVTLITRADIERLQAPELAELIGRQAGLQFARTGGPGSQASLFARGAGSSQVLVLVDGVRLNSVNVGSATLGGINLDTIERIEIARGNLSSLYGSEAIGGVVQIFTRGNGAQREVVAQAEAGSGRTRGGSVSATDTFGPLRVSATAAGRSSTPFSAIDPAAAAGANPDVDGNRHRSGALRLSGALGAATRVGLSAWTQRNKTDFDDSFDGPATTQRETARAESWQATLRQQLGTAWSVDASAGQADEESDNRASDPFSFNNNRFETRNRQAQLVLRAQPARGAGTQLGTQLEAQFGLEYLDQRGAATSFDPAFSGALVRFDRHVNSAWLGVTGRSGGRHQWQLNARHDDYADVGGRSTWLAAYGYALTPSLRATLQASTAFRAPSFNDLHFPGFGNAQLRPERARSEEAGLRYARAFDGGSARGALAVFRTRTRDLIQFDPAASRAENIARAEAQGAELTAGFTLGAWQADAAATWLSAEDAATGNDLVRRAPRTFNLALFRSLGVLRVGAAASHVAARSDFDIATFARKQLPSYTLLRALAAWRATPQLTLKLRIENLTDENYALVDGYNTSGRSVFGGIEVRL
jgi:vitamin B12 transporter